MTRISNTSGHLLASSVIVFLAFLGAGCDSVEDSATNLDRLTLRPLSPASDAIVDGKVPVEFRWILEGEEPDGQFQYRIALSPNLTIATNPEVRGSSNAFQNGQYIESWSLSIVGSASDPIPDTLYWRMQMQSEDYTSPWTATRRFFTEPD